MTRFMWQVQVEIREFKGTELDKIQVTCLLSQAWLALCDSRNQTYGPSEKIISSNQIVQTENFV